GGGIESGGVIPTTLTCYNCKFLGNTATGGGGGISCSFTYGELTNCFFSGNSVSDTGGAVRIAGDTQNLKVNNCTFSRNNATNQGGGIYASTGADVILYNSILWGNTAGQNSTV